MSDKTMQEATKAKWSAREKALTLVLAVFFLAAVVAVAFNVANAVPSNAAAKVDGSYLSEQRVADWISEYRGTYSLTDDQDFADSLSSNGQSVSDFRIYVINQLITNDLVQKRADELGITVTDDEVQAEYDSVVGSVSSGDNSLFQSTIDAMGLTEQSLKARYRNNLLEEKLVEADVPVTAPSEEETLSYITSYLAGSTQMHVSRIVFNGSDKESKAQQCYNELKSEKEAGTLTNEKFVEMAKKYSDEEDVASTGGSLGWTGSGLIPSEISEDLETMSVGDITGINTVEDDGDAYEIAYVDGSYTFPESGSFSSLSDLNMPSELNDVVSSAVALIVWKTNCSNYLANLLAKASITYYPVPENASYNVSIG